MEARNLKLVGFGSYMPDLNYCGTPELFELMNVEIAKANAARAEKSQGEISPIVLPKAGEGLVKRQTDAKNYPEFYDAVMKVLEENRKGLKIEASGDSLRYSFNGTDALTTELAAIFNNSKKKDVPAVEAGMSVKEMTAAQADTFQKVLREKGSDLNYEKTLGGSVQNAVNAYFALVGSKANVDFTHITSSDVALGTCGTIPEKYELKSATRSDRKNPLNEKEIKDAEDADIIMMPLSSLKFKDIVENIQERRKEGAVMVMTLHGDSPTENPKLLNYANIVVGNVEQYEKYPQLIEKNPEKVFVITDAENGLYMAYNGKCKHFPTVVLGKNDYVNALGARDGVTGAAILLATMMVRDPKAWNEKLDEIGDKGNAAAAAACRVLETKISQDAHPFIMFRVEQAPDGGPWKRHEAMADLANAAASQVCTMKGTALGLDDHGKIIGRYLMIWEHREECERAGAVRFDRVKGILPTTCTCC